MIVEHCDDLSDDLSGCKVSLDPEQSGHAELTIHSATDLAGNTDRRAVVGSSSLFVSGLGAVARFASVAFRHPHGFDRLPIGKLKKVANSAVQGGKALLDLGHSDPIIFRLQ